MRRKLEDDGQETEKADETQCVQSAALDVESQHVAERERPDPQGQGHKQTFAELGKQFEKRNRIDGTQH